MATKIITYAKEKLSF